MGCRDLTSLTWKVVDALFMYFLYLEIDNKGKGGKKKKDLNLRVTEALVVDDEAGCDQNQNVAQ